MKHKSSAVIVPAVAAVSLAALFALAPVMAGSPANCSTLKGCEQKICQIEMQLAMAKQSGDASQVTGGQMALDNARTSCDDSKLKGTLNAKLAEANQNLVRYQADLQRAEQDGAKDQMLQLRKQLEQVNTEIQRLKQQLSQLEQLPL
ncbi:DUF1090 family protein [Rheinheimera sp.]|uniref:DUF1090 family protein n=1 Tax=Rheinheimera sp. TaxID=1869214 RepID=UPI0026158767|nr:DUF1090 family protein [Rheinheimera sp.]MCA1929551.1 DUF1090 domain-containing protein [Rheinheimera sp.]